MALNTGAVGCCVEVRAALCGGCNQGLRARMEQRVRLPTTNSRAGDFVVAQFGYIGKGTFAEGLAHGRAGQGRATRFAPSEGKIGNQRTYRHLFLFPPDLIPPLARRGRHAALWLSLHVANRVPPREACPRSRLPSTNPPHTHTTPHYSPHLTPHCSRLYVATFLVQCTRVPFRVNVGF